MLPLRRKDIRNSGLPKCCSDPCHSYIHFRSAKDIRPRSGKVPAGPRVLKKLPDVLRCTYDGNLPTTQNPCRSK
ncbi:hypothetical protein BHE74_00018315 [Ensete ventricosum]|nr:hypothetical protein GW17_00035407 [Ensete ventricosum]RWW73773.1 hypothetical protein BHE74_00018315 [Ensete ventricosum]RZS20662.1 hypothetical protein BHM03_00053197 [Ensete ventricosum]